MTLIVTVFRSGGVFEISHVQQLHVHFGKYPSVCLSDSIIPGVKTIALRSSWPGWFAKMELFDPEQIAEDILYFDLDTLIPGKISSYMYRGEFCMLSDFFHPEKPASGMMFIPHYFKATVWEKWIKDPDGWMAKYRGDQDVLESICGCNVARFGVRVKSYKVHVACKGMPGYIQPYSVGKGYIPAETDILCFHGKPRPWDLSKELIKNIYREVHE